MKWFKKRKKLKVDIFEQLIAAYAENEKEICKKIEIQYNFYFKYRDILKLDYSSNSITIYDYKYAFKGVLGSFTLSIYKKQSIDMFTEIITIEENNKIKSFNHTQINEFEEIGRLYNQYKNDLEAKLEKRKIYYEQINLF